MTDTQKRQAVFLTGLKIGCPPRSSMRELCNAILASPSLPDTGLDMVTIANDVLSTM